MATRPYRAFARPVGGADDAWVEFVANELPLDPTAYAPAPWEVVCYGSSEIAEVDFGTLVL